MEAISLFTLNNLVRSTLEEHVCQEYWIQAELSEVRSAYNGHCYVEFVQKNPRTSAIIAKARGTIWRNVWMLISGAFERETGQAFVAGLNVQVLVTVQFHELYGYSLTVLDIDASYTMGDMARKRQEILRQLDEEGVLTLNKELELPMLIQRVAVISSATAAGYGDFCNQLEQNKGGFSFRTQLFPAVMQGEQVESSIIAALDSIAHERDKWDVVVIIRGGGATSDLTGFDTYLLATNCAQFPLPIITGIGHERDDTVIDMVAHTRAKTPTAAAEFLIHHQQEASDYLDELCGRSARAASDYLYRERQRLERHWVKLPSIVALSLLREKQRVEQAMVRAHHLVIKRLEIQQSYVESMWKRATSASERRIKNEEHRIALLEQRAAAVDPVHILKLGYSITIKEGRAVRSAEELCSGDEIETRVADGTFVSVVK